MTATVTETIEALDLSDLDLLDEQHIFCLCLGPAPKIATADCGKRAFMRGLRITVEMLGDICPDCVMRIGDPCPRCGG